MKTGDGLLFSTDDIAGMRARVAQHAWAARALDKVRGGLETRRTDFINGEATFAAGGERAKELLALAVCSRLADGWYRDAALALVASVQNLPSFVGLYVDRDTGFNYGLNGLMISRASQDVCLALDFLEEVTDEARGRLIERVLVPIGDRLKNEIPRGGSNWQAMENLALLCIGLTAARPDYVDVVQSDPSRSFGYHLANSVHSDGFWYEQSLGYHMGTTDHLLKTRWIAGRHGIDLGGDDVLRRMIDVAPRMALPEGHLPLLADAHPQTLCDRVGFLEVAYAMYKPSWAGWALRQTRRDDLWSLLVGREIREEACPAVRSELFESAGVCVLKQGKTPEFWKGQGSGATITFGPHGDWHGHPGKLGIEYRHKSRYLVRDSGIGSGYALPMHRGWFATTAAHSTLVVDGNQQTFTRTFDKSEKEKNETGRCHAALLEGAVQACTASADFAYPGCRVRRTLFLAPEYLLDIMECAARDGRERVFDWILHTEGLIQTAFPFARRGLGFHENGYDFFRDTRACDTDDTWSLDVMACTWCDSAPTVGDRDLRVTLLGEPGTTIFTVWCPSDRHDRHSPAILVRRRTAQTVYAALHAPTEDVTLSQIDAEPGALAYRVSSDGAFAHTLAKTETSDGVILTLR